MYYCTYIKNKLLKENIKLLYLNEQEIVFLFVNEWEELRVITKIQLGNKKTHDQKCKSAIRRSFALA